ncbi:MAG: conserved membrane protein of unknown function [Candidatus Thorarchaeota archaeon]|nr:MAG: conserved membrane protein of unknown function [Candidatus Thorarchaeota archaeon]
MVAAQLLVLAIFIGCLVVIISEKISETATALFAMCLAGGVLVVYEICSFRDMIMLIEWDTIIFIAAMLIVVAISGSSGMFQYISLMIIRGTAGEPKRTYLSFMIFVYIMSLFFDPLPTMLIMGAFTVQVCRAMEIDFRPFLISEVIVSNFASIPSVVGSVPNLVIVVWAGIDVGQMFIILMPLSIIMLVVTLPILLWYYEDTLVPEEEHDSSLLLLIQPGIMIKSRHDFYLSAIGMAALVLGFVIGPALGVEASFIAMIVASAMLVFSNERAKSLLRRLSWDTLFFLIAMFGLVVALERVGLIEGLIGGVSYLTGGNIFLAMAFLIWIPGLALSIIDNIPVAAVLAPLAQEYGAVNAVVPLSLIAGSNIGGYIIPFGDAPNMIAASLAADEGMPITFKEFTKIAFPLGLLHLIMVTIYTFIVALFV